MHISYTVYSHNNKLGSHIPERRLLYDKLIFIIELHEAGNTLLVFLSAENSWISIGENKALLLLMKIYSLNTS